MTDVVPAGERRGRWAWARRRIAAACRAVAVAPYAVVVGGGLLAVAALAQSLAGAGAGASPQFVLALCVTGLASTLPIAFLGTAAAAVVMGGAAVVSATVFGTFTAAGVIALLICAYRLGRSGPPAPALVLALPFLVLALAGPVTAGAHLPEVLLASLIPATALAGIARKARGEAREGRMARQLMAGTLVEHTARGERARIARELHDIVAHHISMISVQAEAARLTTPGMPAAGARRLSQIGDTARDALTEMRRLLGVLREDAGADVAYRQPQPGLRELTELIDEAREASGTGIRLILSGSPATLDPGVELAAYRIIQEALTNARRHAPGAAVDVELHYTDDALHLRVRDNGPGPPAQALPGGHGLTGMRERAAAAGGELRTGPAAGGGFLVAARLPAKLEEAA